MPCLGVVITSKSMPCLACGMQSISFLSTTIAFCFFVFYSCVHTDGRQRVWESKSDVIHEITDSRVFTENRALSVSSFYRCVTSCKKSKKSLEPFSRKMTTYLTNQPTNNTSWSSTDVENCNVVKRLAQRQSHHLCPGMNCSLSKISEVLKVSTGYKNLAGQ